MPLLGTNQLMLKGMLQGTTLFSPPWKVESKAHLLVELWIQEKKCSCSHNHGTPDQLLTQVRLCESVMGLCQTSSHMLWKTIGEGIDAHPLGNLMGVWFGCYCYRPFSPCTTIRVVCQTGSWWALSSSRTVLCHQFYLQLLWPHQAMTSSVHVVPLNTKLWSTTYTMVVCSWVWSKWNENQHQKSETKGLSWNGVCAHFGLGASDGGVERDIDRWTGMATAVMCMLYWSAVAKKPISHPSPGTRWDGSASD